MKIVMSEHVCFYCDKIAICVDGKEVTEPCEHRKAALEAELQRMLATARTREIKITYSTLYGSVTETHPVGDCVSCDINAGRCTTSGECGTGKSVVSSEPQSWRDRPPLL